MERWELSRSELAEFCSCPVDALRFSRVGPVHLAHGGAWARLDALVSLRWPFLDAPAIHGPAVGGPPPCPIAGALELRAGSGLPEFDQLAAASRLPRGAAIG